jgi:hypothetical protein
MREQLIQFVRANPFVPFTIALSNGEILPVGSVELIGVGTKLFFYVDLTGIVIHHRISSIHHLGQREDATL